MFAGLIFQRQTSKQPYLPFKSETAGLGFNGNNNFSNLHKRCITAVILGPAVIALIFAGFPYLNIFIGFVVSMMWFEWGRMVKPDHSRLLSLFCAILIASVLFASLEIWSLAWTSMVLGSCTVWMLFRVLKLNFSLLSGAAFFGFGTIGLSMQWLQTFPSNGSILLLWLLVLVWATDSGAYFFGKLIGGPKLAPSVSPGKTWAGLIGGIFCSALWSTLAGLHFGIASKIELLGLGIILALLAQFGDLLISKAKRKFMVKDTGSLLPGHGGLLDRVDGLLLTVPTFTVFLLV
ncbi:MAG: phosphatidate cytidylyltransferase [Alphaproteobacteria bacterium]